MKSTFQYLYSIAVFFGVLMTTYLMIHKEGDTRLPLHVFNASSALEKREAKILDPGVQTLLDIQQALKKQQEKQDALENKSPASVTGSKPGFADPFPRVR